MSQQGEPTSTGGDDRYRALFEGSQTSLADMAARQAQALGRVGRLRSAIVTVLRKNFMELSAQAEANLGRRLSEADDEVLLAYLDAFTGAASRADQRATVQALGEAVIALGIPLRGDDPLVWVEQIHRHRQELRNQANRARGWETVDATIPPVDSGHSGTAGSANGSTQHPVPVEDYWQWEDAPALKQLFADTPPTATATTDPATDDRRSLGGLFADLDEPRLWDAGDDGERWTPSPVQPRPNPRPERPAQEQPADAASPNVTVPPATDKPATHRPTGKNRKPVPATSPPAATPVATPAAAPTALTTATPDAAPAAVPVTKSLEDGAPPDAPVDDPTRLPAETPSHRDPTGQGPAGGRRPDSVATTPRGSGDGGQVGDIGVGQPFRPELFPATSTRKKKPRTVRTQAQAPSDSPSLIELVQAEGGRELDEQTRNALLAAASIPRPVFTRDLVAVAGSVELVDAWEAECRANVSTSPVRFVVPKSRHRLRGRLVAVERSDAKPTDWWYQAVQRYRAGKLYELGVLLHRIGDEVVSFALDEHTALFRLNTPKGLLGVIVALETRVTNGEPARAQLDDLLRRMSTERLTLLAVLSASAEPGALEGLIDAVEETSRSGDVTFTFPVVAARSWEYADDRGSSAVMVAGS